MFSLNLPNFLFIRLAPLSENLPSLKEPFVQKVIINSLDVEKELLRRFESCPVIVNSSPKAQGLITELQRLELNLASFMSSIVGLDPQAKELIHTRRNKLFS